MLLLYDAAAGHSSGGSFEKQIEQSTDELTFVASQLGVH
jgi:prolyl oligopeptidase PreP (S9A serine peptidase family)